MKLIKNKELDDHIDIINLIIKSNLPKNVECEPDNNKMYLYVNELKERTTKYTRIDVAEVEISLKESDKGIIRVTIKDSEKLSIM